jgi:ankyrin repeat protein
MARNMFGKAFGDGAAFDRDKSIDFFNAADAGNVSEVVALLADARVDVNVVDEHGISAFMLTCYHGRSLLVAKFLEWDKVEVNAVTKTDGGTALLLAVARNHESVVAKLVKCKRVDVNLANIQHVTAIIEAAYNGYESIVCTLLECGGRVDVNATDQFGQSALHNAVDENYEAVVGKLIECERVDVNAATENKLTALISAADKGFESIVARLIECLTIDLNAADTNEVTAIMTATNQGFHSIVDMLAGAGAILSSDHSQYSLHETATVDPNSPPEKKSATLAVLKKHGVMSDNVPSNFQSKYYFQDGEGRIYKRNVKHQRWLNRRILLLVIYRTYQWSIANQIDDEARRTLPPDLSDFGKFICLCWFDCAGGGNDMSNTADTIGNGIGRLIMQY